MIIELDNFFKWEKCPLCGSEKIHEVGELRYREPVMFSTHHVIMKYRPTLGRCRQCKTSFTQNIVSKDLALELYSTGGSDAKWPRNNTFIESKSRNIVTRLSKYFVANKTILDIVCNTGVLLDYAKSLGAITFGIEPSYSSQKILRAKGHHYIDSISSINDKFDVVTAFDLVEHLHDLNGFLKRVHEVLKPGGFLIILTGDVSSPSAQLAAKNWWYLQAPEHIVFPSPNFFDSIEIFDLVSVERTYASRGYKKPLIYSFAQYLRKTLFKGGYDGLSSLGPDHMLLVLKKI